METRLHDTKYQVEISKFLIQLASSASEMRGGGVFSVIAASYKLTKIS